MGFDPRRAACPYTAMAKTCHQARQKHDCPKWVMFQGTNPNSGEQVAEWACADRWMPFLLADNARRLIGVQSAIETRGDASAEQQARTSSALERIAAATPIAGDASMPAVSRQVTLQLQTKTKECK